MYKVTDINELAAILAARLREGLEVSEEILEEKANWHNDAELQKALRLLKEQCWPVALQALKPKKKRLLRQKQIDNKLSFVRKLKTGSGN